MQSNQILRAENKTLRNKIEQLQEEMKILDWWISIHEKGFDNQTLKRKIQELEDEIVQLKKKGEKEKRELENKVTMQKSKLKETQIKLKELFLNVYKPLLKEVKLKEQIIENQNLKVKQMHTSLSVLNSIIRLPRMCSEFHKALRNKASDDLMEATKN